MLTNLTFTHAEKMFKCQSMAPNVSATDPSRPAPRIQGHVDGRGGRGYTFGFSLGAR
jgi:hypothetical protein